MSWAKTQLTLVGIVGPAPKCDVVDAGEAAMRGRNQVMELEPPGFGTPPAWSDERAAAGIPLPDRSPNRGWQVPKAPGPATRPHKLSWARRYRGFLTFKMIDQQRQSALHDGAEVSSWERVLHQILGATKIRVAG